MPVELRGRHYQAGPKGPQAWRCVACGSQQSGPLEQGCSECGAGAPGTHVGVPQRVEPKPEPVTPARPTDTVDQAFVLWRKERHVEVSGDAAGLIYEAFAAGFQAGIGQVSQMATPLAGTAESRTVVAALRMFLENVLPTATEEIQAGEFLSIEATEALIQRLERTNG